MFKVIQFLKIEEIMVKNRRAKSDVFDCSQQKIAFDVQMFGLQAQILS